MISLQTEELLVQLVAKDRVGKLRQEVLEKTSNQMRIRALEKVDKVACIPIGLKQFLLVNVSTELKNIFSFYCLV